MSVKVSGIGVCRAGQVRKENQDSILCDGDRLVFAVADGIGGGDEGALASRIVRDRLADASLAGDLAARRAALDAAIAAANGEVFSHAKAHGLSVMGSTVALVAMEGGDSRRAAVCHAGDSRVYRLRAGLIEPLTRDHTVGVELSGVLGNKGAAASYSLRTNRLAHVLTRAIGTDSAVVCDWSETEIAAGDVYLVCSDGVHDVILNEELPKMMTAPDPGAMADRIAAEVERRGAPDNYSIVIAKVEAC